MVKDPPLVLDLGIRQGMSSVDVIIPCYRYGHFLEKCVESVLTQENVAIRILILDDASPDNTAEVGAALASKDSRVNFVQHEVNKGHIATFNEGIEWTSADYLLLLSADDYLLPGALGRAAAVLDANLDVGFVFGRAVEINDDGAERIIGVLNDETGEIREAVIPGQKFIEHTGARCIVSTPTVVVRTALQKRAGGYRAELPHAGDMEMWLRLAAYGSVGILESSQAVYRRHGENMSHAYFRESKLPDLEQRKLAVECFLDSAGHLVGDVERMRNRFLRELSVNAVGYASDAFNEDEMKLSREFARLAVSLDPGIRQTLPWAKLVCKRIMGPRAWRIVQPMVGKVQPPHVDEGKVP